jgi:hypothetical protein
VVFAALWSQNIDIVDTAQCKLRVALFLIPRERDPDLILSPPAQRGRGRFFSIIVAARFARTAVINSWAVEITRRFSKGLIFRNGDKTGAALARARPRSHYPVPNRRGRGLIFLHTPLPTGRARIRLCCEFFSLWCSGHKKTIKNQGRALGWVRELGPDLPVTRYCLLDGVC